jgi:AcrR family transcriptional regulator
VVVAQAISIKLKAALEGRSIRQVAAEADLAHTTVYDLLAGKTYGDVITVARLEAALETSLWPRDPTGRRRDV